MQVATALIAAALEADGKGWLLGGRRRELDIEHYSTVRLHECIGCVTPDDEHHGGGEAIRKGR